MSVLEKIKAEIQKVLDAEGDSESAKAQALALFWVLELLDKYASEECDRDCEHCAYLECPKEPSEVVTHALPYEPVMYYPQVDGITPTVVKTKDVYVSTSMTATVVTTKESEDLDGEEVEDAYQVRLSVKDVIDNLKRIVDQGRVNSLDALYIFGACQFLEQIKE